MRLIVGITGASGVIYAKRLLEVLKKKEIEVDLIITPSARYNIETELGIKSEELEALSTRSYDIYDTSADIASGTRIRDGMIVIPCTMNTVAKMAHGISDNLLLRCFDVMLKENKKIVIVPRETPLDENHLENLLRLRRMGVVIIGAMPAFYHKPKSIDDLVDFIVAKVLDQFDIPHKLIERWEGLRK
ncbi:MAG: UbiX family flavin prenyltransferase [Candidatus Methanospirareceae archaeon]